MVQKQNIIILKAIVKENFSDSFGVISAPKNISSRTDLYNGQYLAEFYSKQAKNYIENLYNLLTNNLNYQPDLWSLLKKNYILPEKPKIKKPELPAIPAKREISKEDFINYKKKPVVESFKEKAPIVEDYRVANAYDYHQWICIALVSIIIFVIISLIQ